MAPRPDAFTLARSHDGTAVANRYRHRRSAFGAAPDLCSRFQEDLMTMSQARLAMTAATFAASLVALTPARSAAQIVPYAGFTNGCFGVGCVLPTTGTFHTAVLGGLTFQNSTFSGSTLAGFAGIGDNAARLGT